MAGPVVEFVDVALGQEWFDLGDPLVEQFDVVVQRNEHEPVPHRHAVAGKAVLGLVELVLVGEGDGEQPPVFGVGPGVVRALNALAVCRAVDQECSPMCTQVRERSERSVLLAEQQDGMAPDRDGELIAGVRNGVCGSDEDPVAVPDALQLERRKGRAAKGFVGQRSARIERERGCVGHGCNLVKTAGRRCHPRMACAVRPPTRATENT